MLYDDSDPEGPTDAELKAIEAEWPRIEAELKQLDAWIRFLTADDGLSPLPRRRLRRAEHRVLRTAAALASRPPDAPRRAA